MHSLSGSHYIDRLTRNLARLIRVNRVVLSARTRHQAVEIVETPEFGRMLFIDNRVQLSEADEYIYHEMLVHPAMLSHPEPRSVLIIGGGDGGALREVVKHGTVRRVVLVELDGEVIEICRKHLGSVSAGAFDDPRVEVVVGDGREYVASSPEKFDVIILDLVDPYGQASRLYTYEFYLECKRLLGGGGVIVTHAQSPYLLGRYFASIFRTMASAFRYARAYGSWIPSFGLYWMFVVASDAVDPAEVDEEEVEKRFRERGLSTRHYWPKMHRAMFTLPKDVYEALQRSDVEISTDENPVSVDI